MIPPVFRFTTNGPPIFNVVIYRRLPLWASLEAAGILREAIRAEKASRPFQIDAMVILRNHIHALQTLPSRDADYSIRWRNINMHYNPVKHDLAHI
jgi:putative transposase